MATPTLPRKIIINNSIYFMPLSRSLFLRATEEPNIDTEVFARGVQVSSFSFLHKCALTLLSYSRFYFSFIKYLAYVFLAVWNARNAYSWSPNFYFKKKKKEYRNPLHKHVFISSGDDERLENFHENFLAFPLFSPPLLQWIIHSNAMLLCLVRWNCSYRRPIYLRMFHL